MEEPIMVYRKNADRTTYRIIIPKAIIQQWGRHFYMKVYQDKIVLEPIKEKKGE